METWQLYERLIAMLKTEDFFSSDMTVTPNARVDGLYSGRKRQIDVLIDFRYDFDVARRIIVDAKCRSRAIDVKDVESFEGMMKDVGATKGYIVCSNGHSKAAGRRALDSVVTRFLKCCSAYGIN